MSALDLADLAGLVCDEHPDSDPITCGWKATVPTLVAALQAVIKMHTPSTIHPFTDDGYLDYDVTLRTYCTECTPIETVEAIGDGEWDDDMETSEYPCPTLHALREAGIDTTRQETTP